MSRLVEALRSLGAEPAETESAEAGRGPTIRPRRRDQNALLQNILKRLSLLGGESSSAAAPTAAADVRSATTGESGAAVTPQAARSSGVATREDWEVALAKDLSQPAVEQSYRQLAERVLRDVPAGMPQSLLLTSLGCAGDETIMRLGWLLAGMRGPALVIDANRSLTPLTIHLQRMGQPGLEEVLRGGTVKPLPTGHDELFFLPAGTQAPSADPPTISSLGNCLGKWRSEYPLVLIDGGDALSDNATALSRICDATYLLIGLGTATTESAREATRRFRSAGGRVLGCIAVEPAESPIS